jgi:hypothetical protein
MVLINRKTSQNKERTMGRPSKVNLPTFSQNFQQEDWLYQGKQRRRKFNPKSFFLTLVNLVGSTNGDGYLSALMLSFGSAKKIPNKSSLTKLRKKISFKFFAREFYSLIDGFDAKRFNFNGYRIYAIDGAQWNLPRTEDVIKNLYTGKAIGKYRAGYLPKMYVTHAWDVLTGVSKDVRFAPYLDEPFDARLMVKSFEKNSITLYDRLYISMKMIEAHRDAGNYFIMRARTNFKAVKRFLNSEVNQRTGKFINRHLTQVKVINPKTGKHEVYVTNLKESWVNPKIIYEIYRMRWEAEVAFKELSETLKIEQWHSKNMNAILQEFYAAFWLMNYSRIQITLRSKPPRSHLLRAYKKPNYKLILRVIIHQMRNFFQGKRRLLHELEILIKLSTETRIHLSREYPRIVKSPKKHYPYYGWMWEFPF